MYNGAPPMFYAQAPGQPYVYPQMVPARGGRFPPPGPYQMPGYVIVNARGQVKNARGNVVQPRRGGMKGGQPVAAPAAVPLVQPVVVPQTPIPPAEAIPLTPQYLNAFSPEEQKQIIGERLYVLIAKTQPQLAAKITGMILDSSYPEEMLHLIESPEALTEKVDEALNVLKEHNEKQTD
jgi:polyadenylate-binding protein